MHKHKFTRTKINLLVAACLTIGTAPAAFADSDAQQMQQMQQEIQTLEQRLQDMQQAQAATQAKVDTVAANPGITQSSDKVIHYGGVNIRLGGFLASETVYRTTSLQSDIASPFSHIAFPSTAQGSAYNQSEFRGTERQSRFSLLADGKVNPDTILSGYYELDFLGAAPTANANESNSYNPRTRHVYANIDWLDTGVHVLAGQTWSLATMNTQGITPRNEEIPLTIDAQYVPGFTWARQWQLRVVKDWDKKLWAAVSLENSQTSGVAGTSTDNTGGTVNNVYTLAPPGGSLYAAPLMSVNKYPDIVAKLAAETDFGHFEIYDLTRNFESVYGPTAATENAQQSKWTSAVGAGAVIPLIPKQLELSLSGLFGTGVGRYGTSGLLDSTYNSDGSLHPLKGSQMLAGITWHADPKVDLYGYVGQDKVDGSTYTVGANTYGYGDNVTGAGIGAELNKISQETVGVWWSFYKGGYGAAKLGAQFSHTLVTGFQVANVAPTTTDNMVFTSLRYFPF